MAKEKLSREKLLKMLGDDQFDAVVKLGAAAASILRDIAEGSDVLAAAKAVSVVGRMNFKDADKIIDAAARSRRRAIRVAAASAAAQLGAAGESTLKYLLKSTDASVRKWAIRCAKDAGGQALQADLQKISDNDPINSLRAAAAEILTSGEGG